MTYPRGRRPSRPAIIGLLLAMLVSCRLVSPSPAPADGLPNPLGKAAVHPGPGRLLADSQQRLQPDVTREMQRLHVETTRDFVQRPGMGMMRMSIPPTDPRTNVLT